MNKYCQLALVSTLICSTPNVLAETFNYTNVSVSYGLFTEKIDGITNDLKGDGIGFDLSISISPNLAFTAGYGTASMDISSGGSTLVADGDAGGVGIIYHVPISGTADFVAGIGLIQGNVDIKIDGSLFSSNDANGNSVFVGIRAMTANNLELNAFIDRSDIESSTSTDIEFGVAFYIDESVSLNASYSFDSDGDSLLFGATKYF